MEEYIRDKFEEFYTGVDLSTLPSGQYKHLTVQTAYEAFMEGFTKAKESITITLSGYSEEVVAVSMQTEDYEMFHIIWSKTHDENYEIQEKQMNAKQAREGSLEVIRKITEESIARIHYEINFSVGRGEFSLRTPTVKGILEVIVDHFQSLGYDVESVDWLTGELVFDISW